MDAITDFQVLVNGMFLSANTADNRVFIELALVPNGDAVVFTFIVAPVAWVIFTAALKFDCSDIFRGLIMYASRLMIDCWTVNFWHSTTSKL